MPIFLRDNMIKNIVLDMGNVCCRWDINYLSQCLANHKEDQQLIIKKLFQSRQWQLLDAGMISLKQAEDEILKDIDDHKKEVIQNALYHWYDFFDQFDEMENYLVQLKKEGYRLYLLSNCSMQFYDYYQDKSIFSHFDDYYISAKYQLIKPTKEIFLDFLDKFHLKAQECLFVDDVKENIDGAKKVGMQGIVYHGSTDEIEHILRMDKIHQ